MKKIIIGAIICGITLGAGFAATGNSAMEFTEGLIIGLVVIGILIGSSAIIAVKDHRKHA